MSETADKVLHDTEKALWKAYGEIVALPAETATGLERQLLIDQVQDIAMQVSAARARVRHVLPPAAVETGR